MRAELMTATTTIDVRARMVFGATLDVISAFSSARESSSLAPPCSRARNFDSRVPDSSPASSAPASASASINWMRSAMRSNVSNASLSRRGIGARARCSSGGSALDRQRASQSHRRRRERAELVLEVRLAQPAGEVTHFPSATRCCRGTHN